MRTVVLRLFTHNHFIFFTIVEMLWESGSLVQIAPLGLVMLSTFLTMTEV